MEHAADFEWRGEGEGAEIVLYAPDAATAERAFQRTLDASELPGIVSPLHIAASISSGYCDPGQDPGRGLDIGWAAASETHAAPDLFSAPARGLLLVADISVADLGVPPGDVGDLVLRNVSEISLPRLGEAEVRRAVESGALWAAEEGVISEEDLAFFGAGTPGEPDALPRRALSTGARDFDRYRSATVLGISEVLDADHAEALELSTGALAISTKAAPEDLGRLALTAHRERILSRVWSGDFGATAELPAAPLETEEATDLLAVAQAIANYSDARAALRLYELRQALAEEGRLTLRAAWRLGGLALQDGLLLHRQGLAVAGGEDALVVRDSIAVATGGMRGSAPPFGPGSGEDPWAWEEAALLERVARLGPLEG